MKNKDRKIAEDYLKKGLQNLQGYIIALNYFSEAINADEDYAEAYYQRGWTKGMLNKNEDAIEDLTKAIDLKPDFAEAYCFRGATYLNLKKINEARSDFEKAVELGDTDAPDMIRDCC